MENRGVTRDVIIAYYVQQGMAFIYILRGRPVGSTIFKFKNKFINYAENKLLWQHKI